MNRPLEGIVVLEFRHYMAGPRLEQKTMARVQILGRPAEANFSAKTPFTFTA
jgi:hypothetical protein